MNAAYEAHYERVEADKIHQIKQFISEHSHKDISLNILAQKVDLSPIYISKMFKEKLGINYIDFLTECRIEKAKKLLNDPERSLKEITFEVGYHEPNYFSKVFKKMCGVSPKEYRKTLMSKKSKSDRGQVDETKGYNRMAIGNDFDTSYLYSYTKADIGDR